MSRPWYRSRSTLPVFSGPTLERRGRLHEPPCKGALDGIGIPRKGNCRCGAAVDRIEAHAPFEILRSTESSMLVRPNGFAPVWVEIVPVFTSSAPAIDQASKGEDRRRKPSPPDYLEVETWLGMGNALKAGRRKTPPKGGDIVIIRRDTEDDSRIWRLLCTVTRDEGTCALLVDASIAREGVFESSWAQQRLVPLYDDQGRSLELNQRLVPVFPLPDGTESPGWA